MRQPSTAITTTPLPQKRGKVSGDGARWGSFSCSTRPAFRESGEDQDVGEGVVEASGDVGEFGREGVQDPVEPGKVASIVSTKPARTRHPGGAVTLVWERGSPSRVGGVGLPAWPGPVAHSSCHQLSERDLGLEVTAPESDSPWLARAERVALTERWSADPLG